MYAMGFEGGAAVRHGGIYYGEYENHVEGVARASGLQS
jgi:hypothetical protein